MLTSLPTGIRRQIPPKFSARHTSLCGRTNIIIAGDLDERATLNWQQFSTLEPIVVFNLRQLHRINSCGVRTWINFIEKLPPTVAEVRFEQCAPSFVDQAARITNFLGKGNLSSCIAIFSCVSCGTELEYPLQFADLSSEKKNIIPQPNCPKCQKPLDLTAPENESLHVLFDIAHPHDGANSDDADRFIDTLSSGVSIPQEAINIVKGLSIAAAIVTDRGSILFANLGFKELCRQTGHSPISGANIDDVLQFCRGTTKFSVSAAISTLQHPQAHRELSLVQQANSSYSVEILPVQLGCSFAVVIYDFTLEAQLQRNRHQQRKHLKTFENITESLRTQLTDQRSALDDLRQRAELSAEHTQRIDKLLPCVERYAASYHFTGTTLSMLQTHITAAVAATEDGRTPSIKSSDLSTHLQASLRLVEELSSLVQHARTQLADLDLRSICTHAIELFRRSHVITTTITTDFPMTPAPIRAEEGPILQTLVNVLLNASQATTSRGDAAAIAIQIKEAEQQWLLTITDNGGGMSEIVRRRAFEPFFTTKPPGQATGLGLSLAQRTVDNLGGKIDIQSKLGHGSCVTIRLPKQRLDEPS